MQGVAFGPGTAPRIFAGLLAVIGVVVAVTGLLTDGPDIEGFALRGPAYVLAAIVAFAVMMQGMLFVPPFGLVASSFLAFIDFDRRLARDALGREPDRSGGDDAVLRRAVLYVSEAAVPALAVVHLSGQDDVRSLRKISRSASRSPRSRLNIGFCLLGALVGTLVGVLPGIGTVATVAMLLPITFGLPPVGALIMLAGIYYGAQYGGSTTSILVNIPGEATSVVTCLDGHQMARQGRAGAALAIAAIGSFFAGCFSTVLVAALGAPLTSARAAVRAGRIFLADGARPDLRGRAGARARCSRRSP